MIVDYGVILTWRRVGQTPKLGMRNSHPGSSVLRMLPYSSFLISLRCHRRHSGYEFNIAEAEAELLFFWGVELTVARDLH